MNTQTQVDAAASPPNATFDHGEFEVAVTSATMIDQQTDNARTDILKPMLVFAQHGGATREINISANQVLVALAVSFCLAVPLVWVFVRYWLFGP